MGVQGTFEAVDHYFDVGWFAKGWAFNPERPGERVRLVLWCDGKRATEFVADQYRVDLGAAGLGDGHCAFEVRLPDDLLDGRPHRLEVAIAGERRYLPNSAGDVFFPNFHRGQVENVDHGSLKGWAVNMLMPDRPATLDLVVDGVWLDRVCCGLPRPDLRAHGVLGGGGFVHALSTDVMDGRSHHLELFFANTRQTLEGGSFDFVYPPEMLTTRRGRMERAVRNARTALRQQEQDLANEPLNRLNDADAYRRWLGGHETAIGERVRYLEEVGVKCPAIEIIDVDNGVAVDHLVARIVASTASAVVLRRPDVRLHDHFEPLVAAALGDQCAKIVYTDFDHLKSDGQRLQPHFLPDWDPDRHRDKPYVATEAAIVRSHLLDAIRQVGDAAGHGDIQKWVEAVVDWALVGARDDAIRHLPHVLVHCPERMPAWRNEQDRMARVQRWLAEDGDPLAVVEPLPGGRLRVRRSLPDPAPAVAVIIPTRDSVDLLRVAVEGVLQKTSYAGLSVIIVDNDSRQHETLEYLRSLADQPAVSVRRCPGPFNYAALHNEVIAEIDLPYICLLNNDVQIIHPDWLGEMMSHAVRPDVAAVGAKLLFPDGMIQHGGVVVGQHGVADNAQQVFADYETGYLDSAIVVQNVSGVTAACMVCRTEDYRSVGGMDAENLPISFNDVDLCMKLRALGRRVIWTPHARLYHHESASRGRDRSMESAGQARREARLLRDRWATGTFIDPFYSPNLSRELQTHVDFNWPDRHPRPFLELEVSG